MRGLIDLQAEIKLRRQAIEDIKQKLEQGDPIYDSPQRYKSCTEQALSEYRQRTSRTKYAQNPAYMQFREQIWEVSQTGAMPPITDLVPAEPGDEADSDEDLVVGGVMQDYKCPLSARILEDPLSSTVCKHSYSRREVMEYLAGNGGTARCPATGCDKVITRQNLKENRELRKRVAAYERREEEREIKRRGTQLTQVID
ncbi:hypothetical protein IE53DRAFT_389887 [Violaceomyces palustris]|uniref:Uncharacterized protein n=1 Tax=Violaceomyces palustris TaxID=1673888 RepID=A0ACD0NQ36_9BASI|nr:hypothetical protein IE53DRAFT_389887 [Violaceomyces palustris]